MCNCSGLPGLCLAASFLSPLRAAEVTGDLAAFQLVRDVQAANETAFPQGQVTFQSTSVAYHTAQGRRRALGRDIYAGTVVWRDAGSYWSYQGSFESQNAAGEWEPARGPQSCQRIVGPQGRLDYAESVDGEGLADRVVHRRYGADNPTSDDLAVLPKQVWYGSGAPDVVRSWHTILDPDFNTRGIVRRMVDRPAADQIRVRLVPPSGVATEIICSLAAGGNVVRYERPVRKDSPPGGWGSGETSTFQWESLPDGRFLLKRLENVTTDGSGEFTGSYLLEIRDFNPQPTTAADRFRFESIRFPDGTRVVDFRNGAVDVTTVGKKVQVNAVTQKRLDDLADKARGQGFGAPARE